MAIGLLRVCLSSAPSSTTKNLIFLVLVTSLLSLVKVNMKVQLETLNRRTNRNEQGMMMMMMRNAVMECQLEVQKRQVETNIDHWIANPKPLLADVVQINDQHVHAIFYVALIPNYLEFVLHEIVGWKCNGEDVGRSLDWTRKAHTLIIQCPLASPDSTLDTITLTTWADTQHKNSTITTTYATREFRNCDRLSQMVEPRAALVTNSEAKKPPTAPPRLAFCTSIRGDNVRRVVDQWVLFHRLLGVEHFFIYINEAWQDLNLLPQRDYVTYVPFDYCLANHLQVLEAHNRSDLLHPVYWHQYPIFQNLINTHCLQRSKRMGFDWIATPDVDEYMRITAPNVTSLPELFQSSTFQATDKVGALLMKSRPYGRNPFDPIDTNHSLLVDYVWHRGFDPKRPKIWTNPKTVHHLATHNIYVLRGGASMIPLDPDTQLHLHHYKNPEKGIFRGGRDPKLYVRDDTLSLRFHDEIWNRLRELPNTSHVYSNNG